jgi:hypothetical protein
MAAAMEMCMDWLWRAYTLIEEVSVVCVCIVLSIQ